MTHSHDLDASVTPAADAAELDPADIAIGQRVTAARERVGHSRLMLAALAGVSPPTVQRIEDGHATSVATLRAFAKALGVTLAELVSE